MIYTEQGLFSYSGMQKMNLGNRGPTTARRKS